ncbi:S-adenosyl-L-methionine-dependent methyltransferase [Trichoderma citrinoviride]|uniref:S-adenosyl-L-methionine-dependent methyltransferase n=1 Tax=Trichoderma citrinoviride TaxID=58853 RepID=A0A2T4B966_9HYPO|nr:S-adenosyl-L-methionine-dependent methyltransferase [Trichoderma citrinoviride]PTB65864.1 S-adenosyl-L-methionine-dependent methyltransferase [Trichoderma citrinoviride]
MGPSGTAPGENPNRSSLVDLKNFQFTFDCSNIIEPDVCVLFLRPRNPDDTISLSESVRDFPREFGRTYHAYRAGSYAYPNDIPEQERLAFQGPIIKRLFGDRLYFAPLSQSRPPRYILDVATGVGDWAIEMGDMFPTSEVIGTDLSPIQPDMVPPNVKFYVDDSADEWNFTEKFGYIHTRLTAGCWGCFETEIAQQAFDALEPGGWFESQEVEGVFGCDDGTLDPAGPMCTWLHEMRLAAEQMQRPAVLGSMLKEVFERVGFVDVQQLIFKIPTNEWPRDERLKEIGRLWGENFSQGLNGFSIQLMNRVFGRSPAEIELQLVKIREELSNPQIHAYMPVFVVWGRKPYVGERVNTRMSD